MTLDKIINNDDLLTSMHKDDLRIIHTLQRMIAELREERHRLRDNIIRLYEERIDTLTNQINALQPTGATHMQDVHREPRQRLEELRHQKTIAREHEQIKAELDLLQPFLYELRLKREELEETQGYERINGALHDPRTQ